MKMMIWKELRENFKWGVMAFLALLLAEIYVLAGERGDFSPQGGFTLCAPAFLLTTSFGSAIIGAALGTAQILPERRRDRWAALLHRPVPRGVIYFGKATAGLLLCLLATLLPLLASTCFVAIPGNFPGPFVPGMMLPGLSDLLLAPLFYFSALLVCLHPGRWFGSKGLTALAPVPVFLLHVASTVANINIYCFLVLPLIAALVLMLAAWGCLLGNGPAGSMPRAGRWSYVLVVLAGAQMVFMVLAAVALILGRNESGDDNDAYEKFQVTLDGQVFYVNENANDQLTDIHGKAVTDERYVGDGSYENFCPFIELQNGDSAYREAIGERRRVFAYAWPIRPNYQETELWYLLIRQNYMVGYDRSSRRLAGIFDREGFKPPGEKPAPFPSPLRLAGYSNLGPVLVISGSRVYSLDFPGRRMTMLFDAGNGVLENAEEFGGENGIPNRVAVVLPGKVLVLDQAGGQLAAIPIPHDPARWPFLAISTDKAGDRIYLLSQHPNPWGKTGAEIVPNFLDEYDLHGNPLHTYSQTPAVIPDTTSWPVRVAEFSIPLGPVLIDGFFNPQGGAFGESWGSVIEEFSAVASVLALITFLWARSVGFTAGAALRWAGFAFVFGPAGFLTFRFATDWPVRVRCPSCGKKRSVGGGHCMHCRRPWILPERNGTEIVDGATVGKP